MTPLPALEPGHVIKILFPHSSPPKPKYCLAVSVEKGLFLVINTAPYKWAPADSQVKVWAAEVPGCLDHDSYIDLSKMYEFQDREVDLALKKGVWKSEQTLLKKIKDRVSTQPYLPERQKQLVLENL